MRIPKSKFNVGDQVWAKDETSGHPPKFAATVAVVEWVKDTREHHYTVMEDAAPTFGWVDLYTEDDLSPRGDVAIDHQSQSAEAVKAALMVADCIPIQYQPEGWPAAHKAIYHFKLDQEGSVDTAARILAAHARAVAGEMDKAITEKDRYFQAFTSAEADFQKQLAEADKFFSEKLALSKEVARLREALEEWPKELREKFNLKPGGEIDGPGVEWWEGYEGCITDLERHVSRTLTGEAGASADGWKPIATAPKDRVIDIWSSVERIANCLWMSKDGDAPCFYSRFGNGDSYRNATHWREIPEGPKP